MGGILAAGGTGGEETLVLPAWAAIAALLYVG